MKKIAEFANHWRESIAAKLLIKVFAIYVVVTVVVTMLHMYSQYSVTKDDLSNDLGVFHDSFEPGISIDLWNQDFLSLEREMRAIVNVPQIIGAKVVNAGNDVVLSIGNVTDDEGKVVFYDPETFKKAPSDKLSSIGLFAIKKDIFYQEEDAEYQVGSLYLYSSDSFILSRVHYEYFFIIINAVIKTLALWVIVLWQSKPVITKPLEEFSKHLQSRNLENLSHIKLNLKTDGIRELEMLDKAFNQMANNLDSMIESRNRLTHELIDNEARLRYALSVSNEGIWDWNLVTGKIDFNDSFFSMLGYSDQELQHNFSFWRNLIHDEYKNEFISLIDQVTSGEVLFFNLEYQLLNRDGDYTWVHAKGRIVEHEETGKPTRFVGTHTDISYIKHNETYLQKLATYDSLTNLPNRALFTDLLKSTIAESHRIPARHAVLFLDLDRFKTINDSLGHSIGDELLINVAARLQDVLRETDTVARLGGDEFTILLKNICSLHKAAEVSERIIESLNTPYTLSGHQVVASPSIGIVIFPDHGTSQEELMRKADAAMYISKRKGGSCFNFFKEEMTLQVRTRLEMENQLREAIAHQNVIPFYQSKLRMSDNAIVGFEALARWKHQGNLIPPDKFIPLAEDTGLIIPMGELIMQKTFENTREWISKSIFSGKVSVNISAVQFRQDKLLSRIDELLEVTGLSAHNVEFEITEAVVMEDIEYATDVMNKIKGRGITLALDDFGTGYSSLSYLKKFPIDTLKIDRSFIHDIELDEENMKIVKSIIELAHHMNLEVVAEGVEDQSQADLLHEINCDIAQGYLYSKPMDGADVPDHIKQNV